MVDGSKFFLPVLFTLASTPSGKGHFRDRMHLVLAVLVAASSGNALVLPRFKARSGRIIGTETASMQAHLYEPAARDAHYKGNMAQHLVDMHDAKATFDFCGGMMFQLVLTDKLRSYLVEVAQRGGADAQQPVVYPADANRMAKIKGYSQDANADNVKIFHGREVRQVPDAAGGMNFVLQLSHAGEDPQGWTAPERAGYDGWGHDSGRVWRKGDVLESEGFKTFRSQFGASAFTLHHRFYLHLDGRDRLWLSAEDGCEGTPAQAGARGLFQQFMGQ